MSSASTTPQQLATAQPYALASPLAGTTAAETPGLSFRDILRILEQRRLTIVVTVVLVYLLVVAATLLIRKFAPAWTSEAFFELEAPKTGDWYNPEEREVNPRYMEQLLQNEAAKLKNLGLMLQVVEQPEVKATKYYQWYEADAMRAAMGLQDDLVAAPVPKTQLIRVALSCRERAEARTIVQAVVNRYLATYQDVYAKDMRDRLEGLKNTLATLETNLDEKREEMRSFRESSEIPAMELRRVEARQHVVMLRAQLAELGAAAGALQAQLDALQQIDPRQLPLTAEQELIIESDPMLRYWRAQVENLDVLLATRLQQIGPAHRDIAILERTRQGYAEKERAKREELVEIVRARQIEVLRQQLAQTRAVQGRLQEEFEQIQAEERDLDRNIQTYQQMLVDEAMLHEQIAEVQAKLTEAEHALRDKSRLQLRLIQPPQDPIEPSRPNYILYLGGGLLFAIASGIGLAFLRELTDQGVRTPVDVVRAAHLSVLGCIPLLDDEEADVERIEDAVRVAPHSLVAEAFRRTRTNLQFSGPEETQRSLLITSPGPADGKTAVAVNLAATLAHGNQRVLLIDCNFRRPAIRELFDGTRAEGLSNILVGRGTLAELVTKTKLPNLDVLTSGPMPPTPAELLGSPQMRALLTEATKQYDRVILDGPPTLLISDATVLAMEVAGVVIVARAEDNTRGALRRTREQLESIKARVIGAVLNGVKARPGGYFREQYREFYDYMSEEVPPAELPPAAPEQTGDKT